MSLTHTTAVRTVLADAVCASAGQAGANAKIIIYSGTPPANAQTGLSGNVAIATITGVNFGAASAGISTITSFTADPGAVGGVASFFRLTKTDGTTVVFQGAVATSSAEMTVVSTTIGAGQVVSLAGTNTYTAPV